AQPTRPGPEDRHPACPQVDEGTSKRMDHTNIEHQIERRRKRRRGIFSRLSALAALTLGAGSFSLAQFTDSDTSTWSFTAGSIDIDPGTTVGPAVPRDMPG